MDEYILSVAAAQKHTYIYIIFYFGHVYYAVPIGRALRSQVLAEDGPLSLPCPLGRNEFARKYVWLAVFVVVCSFIAIRVKLILENMVLTISVIKNGMVVSITKWVEVHD